MVGLLEELAFAWTVLTGKQEALDALNLLTHTRTLIDSGVSRGLSIGDYPGHIPRVGEKVEFAWRADSKRKATYLTVQQVVSHPERRLSCEVIMDFHEELAKTPEQRIGYALPTGLSRFQALQPHLSEGENNKTIKGLQRITLRNLKRGYSYSLANVDARLNSEIVSMKGELPRRGDKLPDHLKAKLGFDTEFDVNLRVVNVLYPLAGLPIAVADYSLR